MPMQAKAEGVKLFHAKAQLWALLGFVLMLLWFANSGTMYFMVAGDLLNPLDSTTPNLARYRVDNRPP